MDVENVGFSVGRAHFLEANLERLPLNSVLPRTVSHGRAFIQCADEPSGDQ